MMDAARRIATDAAQVEPTWLEQVGAFGDGRRHPTETELSVAYVAIVPQGTTVPAGGESQLVRALGDVPALTPRQRALARRGARDDSCCVSIRRRSRSVYFRRHSRSANCSRRTSCCSGDVFTKRASAAHCRRHGSSSQPTSGGAKVAAGRRSYSATPRGAGGISAAASGSIY